MKLFLPNRVWDGARPCRSILRMGWPSPGWGSVLRSAGASDARQTGAERERVLVPKIHQPGLPAAGIRREARGAHRKYRRYAHGFLEVDLVIGLAILTLAVMPLAFSFARERQVLQIEYYRSVANEIVDGEMEILAAGAAKDFPDGAQNYSVHAAAAASLPPGHFQLTKTGNHLRLEWQADAKRGIGRIGRETSIP